MAYTIKIGQFAKNIESTAQPNTTGWAEHSVTLKNGADISNPRIELQVSWEDIKDVNYAVMMNRYYWVIGKNMLRENLCQLSLRVDVLATYKTEIGASSLYILRSSTAYDGNIKDNLYPPTADYEYDVQTQDMSSVPGPYNSGYYVVNVAGTSSAGNSTLYQMTPTQFRMLIKDLYAAIGGYNLSDVIPSVVKLFGGNPEKLINSAMWFPFAFSSTVSVSDVLIGGWKPSDTPGVAAIPCEIITNPLEDLDTISFTIEKHPQAATRGTYLNLSPYSNYTLFVPGAGAAQLDSSKLLNSTSITIFRTCDAATGQMLAWCRTDGSPTQLLCELTGQWGVPFKMGGSGSGGNILTGAISTVGAALTGGATGVIGAAAASIGTITSAITGATVSTGSGGSAVNIYQRPVRLDTAFFNVVDEDNTRNGRPLCQVTTPATLGGYMIADKGDVVMAGPLPEHEEVKRYLETGFFYE